MRQLGLFDDRNVVTSSKVETLLPVIAIPFFEDDKVADLAELLASIFKYLPECPVVVYNMNIDEDDLSAVTDLCNSSSCSVRNFRWDLYPKHIKLKYLETFRPVIIQEMLNHTGAVFFVTIDHRFISGIPKQVLDMARQVGIAGWPQLEPTSAVTHPRMFTFFKSAPEKYYFHRHLSGAHLLIYNLIGIHKNLMIPWLQCAFTRDCVEPVGAENSSGCRNSRKPLYLYSGCHQYDQSAMNVALGLAFNFTTQSYSMNNDHFFILIQKKNN